MQRFLVPVWSCSGYKKCWLILIAVAQISALHVVTCSLLFLLVDFVVDAKEFIGSAFEKPYVASATECAANSLVNLALVLTARVVHLQRV